MSLCPHPYLTGPHVYTGDVQYPILWGQSVLDIRFFSHTYSFMSQCQHLNFFFLTLLISSCFFKMYLIYYTSVPRHHCKHGLFLSVLINKSITTHTRTHTHTHTHLQPKTDTPWLSPAKMCLSQILSVFIRSVSLGSGYLIFNEKLQHTDFSTVAVDSVSHILSFNDYSKRLMKPLNWSDGSTNIIDTSHSQQDWGDRPFLKMLLSPSWLKPASAWLFLLWLMQMLCTASDL